MSLEVKSTQKSRAEIIESQYSPLFENDTTLVKDEDYYIEYVKEYSVAQDDEVSSKTEALIHKEKIYKWYIPTVEIDELSAFLADFDYSVEDFYDDPLMVYRVSYGEKAN
jgi:hypothetical protein